MTTLASVYGKKQREVKKVSPGKRTLDVCTGGGEWADVMAFQRSVGNQVVNTLMGHRSRRQTSAGKGINPIVAEPKSEGRQPLYSSTGKFMKSPFGNINASSTTPILQTKLTINTPGDKYEQEADAMADSVMLMRGGQTTHKKPHVGEIRNFLQTKSEHDTPILSPVLGKKIAASQGRGKGIDRNTQMFMSNRFGFDVGNVKIHTDNDAVQMNREIKSRAFTVGDDIYFNTGKYQPYSDAGKHLLAHELTHTKQQNGRNIGVQREGGNKKVDEKPEIDFKILPPEFQLKINHLLFFANTSQVKLDSNTTNLKTSLAYKYGGELSFGMGMNGYSGKAGWVPGENQLRLGFAKGDFNTQFSATPERSKYGIGIHYGDSLLPTQENMSRNFQKGGTAAGDLIRGTPGAMADPLTFYRDHKADIGDVSNSVDIIKKITESGKKKIQFGADLSVTYDPVNKVVVAGRVGFNF